MEEERDLLLVLESAITAIDEAERGRLGEAPPARLSAVELRRSRLALEKIIQEETG